MNDQQQEFQQILTEFELPKQKFEEQKQQVEQYLAQNDVLHLNVGGEHFCTLRSTLTLIKGTTFDQLFSTDEKLLLDRDNRIFLDYDSELFRLMLNQLRQWTEVDDDDRLFDMPRGASYDRQRFRKFLRQLKFDERYFDLQFYNDAHELVGKFVKLRYSSSYRNENKSFTYFYGSHVYSTGSHRIQIKILDPPRSDEGYSSRHYCNGDIYLGVVKFAKNKKQPEPPFIHWRVLIDVQGDHRMFAASQSGDVIEMEINCHEKFVTATNQRTMIERTITPSISLPWRFYVGLENGQPTTIQII